MSMDFNIPLRAKNEKEFSQLKKTDKEIVAYAVLFGADNQTAFMRFHPEYCLPQGGMNQAGKTEAKHFWSYGKTREYREAYEATIEEFLGRRHGASKTSVSLVIDDERKEKARIALYNKVLMLIEGDGELDPDVLKIAVDMAKKLSIVADDIVEQEVPRRYLPERCSSCSYKQFIDAHVESGDIEIVNE